MNTINRMFRINARIVGLVLALLSSCWSSQAKHPEATAQAVAYCDLIKDAQSFSGKRIRVRAIYKYGFEIQRLDPPLCCPNRGLKIWVEIGEHLPNSSEKRFRKLPKGMGLALVTFVGTFESGGPFG